MKFGILTTRQILKNQKKNHWKLQDLQTINRVHVLTHKGFDCLIKVRSIIFQNFKDLVDGQNTEFITYESYHIQMVCLIIVQPIKASIINLLINMLIHKQHQQTTTKKKNIN